jgi:hypothetical protein
MNPHGARLIAVSLPFPTTVCSEEVFFLAESVFGVKMPQRYTFFP